MAKGPFDDELSPEEEALIRNDTAVPPDAEKDEENSVDRAAEEAAAPDAIPNKDEPPAAEEAPPAAGEEQAAAPAIDAEEKAFAEFLEKHKDKPPEELARLAFQQNKRANRSEASNRQIREQVSTLAERAKVAAARRDELAKAAPSLREEFRKKLAEDPDAAAQMLFDGQVDHALNAADAEAQAARIDEAIVFADAHIPNFGEQWPSMHNLARQVGYSDDEINAIDDARPLVILSLANHTARLMMAGVMDRFGNIVNVPEGQTQALDPRLAAPNPQRTLGGGARSTRGSATVEQQLADIAGMTEAELSAFDAANPGAIDNLLKQAA